MNFGEVDAPIASSRAFGRTANQASASRGRNALIPNDCTYEIDRVGSKALTTPVPLSTSHSIGDENSMSQRYGLSSGVSRYAVKSSSIRGVKFPTTSTR